MAKGDVLQLVVFCFLFGTACAAVGTKAKPVVTFAESVAEVMFTYTKYVMYMAPLGVGAAIAVTVGSKGINVLFSLGKLVGTLYGSLLLFVLVGLGGVILLTRIPLKRFVKAVREPFTILWHAGHKDASGSDLLLTETRTIKLSRPEGKKTQVDLKFELKAMRDLTLGGDLQHAGMHFRGSHEILKSKIQNDKAKNAIGADYETAYVWEPADKTKGDDLKWARLMFHIGSNWYSATHMNAPSNPIEELSMRGYGRFGFFFKKDLKKDEVLPLTYRIVTESEKNLKAVPTADEKAEQKKEGAALYEAFTKSLAK